MTTFKKNILWVFFLLFIFAVLPAQAPPYKFEYLTIQDGLSQSSVNCILQDSFGFLWFGTQDGLNRYDGYEFRIFRHHPFDNNSLSNNWVEVMVEAEPGVLWLGTWSEGLNRFDTVNRKITRFRYKGGDKNGLSHNSIRALYVDSGGGLWIGTKGGLDYLATGSNTFKHFRHIPGDPASLSSNEITAVYHDRGGTPWIGTANGLNRLNRQSGQFTRIFHRPEDPGSISGNSITAITEDQKGNLWVSTGRNGLNRFISHLNRFQRFKHQPGDPSSICSSAIFSLLVDAGGSLWLGTGNIDTHGNGVSQLTFNENTARWEAVNYHYKTRSITPDTSPTPYLSDRTVRSIYEDRGGNLWFGTFQWGLNKLNRRRTKFQHFTHNPEVPGSLNDNSVLSFHEDAAGNIWVGTYSGGLNLFHRETNRFTHYKNKNTGSIWVIFSAPSGTLWLGTGGSGLQLFDPGTKTFTPFAANGKDPFKAGRDTITVLKEDSDGVFWLGAWNNGLNLVDRETKRFHHYPVTETGGKHGGIVYIHEDKHKILWLGTYGNGLIKAVKSEGDGKKPVTLHFESYTHNDGDDTSISSDYVKTILETVTDGKEGMWIGTNFGLNYFDRGTGTFTCFSEREGLASNRIYGIVPVGEELWISTNGGLSRFNTRTSEFKNYGTGDGVQSLEFNQGAYLKSSSGRLFFGGINGINAFFPGHIPKNTNIPPIVITGFTKFDKPVTFPRAMHAVEHIQLSYKDRFFAFEFAALDFENPGKNRYAYKLDGFNENWVQYGSRRYVSFSNLDGGDYVFRVKGTNNDGLWNEKGTAVRISISPPFFKTWWFRGLAAALLIGIFLLVHLFRTRHLEHKMEKELLENELKLKADYTAMLVHDLRNPLQCIIGYTELQEGEPDPGNIDYYTGHIKQSSKNMLQLINDMLDISKFEAGKMTIHRERTDLHDIIGRNIRLMEPLLNRKKNRFEQRLDPLPPIDIDPVRLSQVVNNLLSNAVKFSPEAGVITVTAKMVRENECEFQEVSVEDHGPGIKPEKQTVIFSKYAQIDPKSEAAVKGTGLGLAVSRLIVEAHNGAIAYRPNQPTGSIFYFRIPV